MQSFPRNLKGHIDTLDQEIILDSEIVNMYRPVSNLSFLSKLIECIVCVQILNHVEELSIWSIPVSVQTVVQYGNSITLDILQAVDSHGGAVLVLPDLGVSIDTIDHDNL